MELALLVWLISMLGGIHALFAIIAAIFGIIAILYFLSKIDDYDTPVKYRWPLLYSGIAVLCIAINIALPSEKTAYIMVGAYATQQIAQDPKVQQLGAKTLKLIESKLDEYVAEAEKAVAK